MSIPTNDDRCAWALAAVREFRRVCAGSPLDSAYGWGEAIGDLISDVLHLAAKHGLDPIDVVRKGIIMFADERDYPPDGWAPQDKLAQVTITIERGGDDWTNPTDQPKGPDLFDQEPRS